MTEYNNDMRGVLFRQDRKASEKAPDYTGNIEVNGHEYELSGWLRESKAGKKFLSLKVQEPRQREQKPAPRYTAPVEEGFDDELPF